MSLAQSCMKSIPVEDAVGTILCHDITRIVPGKSKGPAFRKGHKITAADIPELLRVGKEHIYVYENLPGILHENDAALRIAQAVAGKNLRFSPPSEGRINFHATCQGLLQINTEALTAVNYLDEISLATLHTMQEVQPDQAVGGTRIVPLIIEEDKIAHLETLVTQPCIDVLPFRAARVGIVTTGSEVYHGRISDAFGPVLKKKFRALGSSIFGQTLTSDDTAMTSAAIKKFVADGADMVVVTGGMSVDPDDKTPASIREAGARIVSYGAPTFPGAMFLLAWLDTTPVVGLPGCVMYHKASILTSLFPACWRECPSHGKTWRAWARRILRLLPSMPLSNLSFWQRLAWI